MGSNSNLHKAKNEKNNEFYTQLVDVARELIHYKEHFKGKVVFCNCNDSIESAFWQYFHLNFAELGLKRLISTSYSQTEPAYEMIYSGGDDETIELGDKIALNGNGDFRSQECIEILKEADIICTNPPFSLFRDYVAQLVEYGKKFLIIGNKNAITYKEFFPLIRDNQVWIGYGSPIDFGTPEGITKKINGLSRWFTNLDNNKRHEKLALQEHYTSEKYPIFDELPQVIDVDKVTEIPIDYDGYMAVPVTFLDKHNPEQFEIIDAINRYTVCDFFGVNTDVQKKHSHCCNINGKAIYKRIVIRRKQKGDWYENKSH